MVLAVEERVEELIALFEREAYRLAPLKGADVSGMDQMRMTLISHPTKSAGIFLQVTMRFPPLSKTEFGSHIRNM